MQKGKRLPGEERKRLIIEAAMKVFAEKGFQGTKTKDIANATGVSEAMIFKIFKNKNDLYNSIIKNNVKDHTQYLGDLFVDIDKFPAVLKQSILHVVERIEDNPFFLRLMLYTALENQQLAVKFAESHLAGEMDGFAKAIEKGIEQGIFREINPTLAAQTFQSVIAGYSIMHYVLKLNKNEPFDKNEVAETIVDIFLNGFKKQNYEK